MPVVGFLLGRRTDARWLIASGLLSGNLAPASALRRAQLELAKDPRYRDPYYWAGFVFQGEWR